MLQVGPDGLKTIFCWYCTHVWQKQIIGIFQTNFVQYGSSNRDITRTESQGEKLGCDQ